MSRPIRLIKGCSQVVRQQTLTLSGAGSNPAIPASAECGRVSSFFSLSMPPCNAGANFMLTRIIDGANIKAEQ